jgi:phage terminase small subunit
MGKAAKPTTKSTIGALTDQMRAFAAEYTVDFCGKAAAIRAGYGEKGAAAQASKLLARDDVQQLVQQRMARVEKKTEVSTERLVLEAWGIATADVNELVEFRRRCCRHCYGIDYGYQRTMQEMSQARRKYELQRRKDEKVAGFDPMVYEEFDELGGAGYDARKPPVPDCTNCWGDGVADAHFKPTGQLTPAARALYAGVKQTKDGYQMLLVDKLGALEKLFRHKGLYQADNDQKGGTFVQFLEAIVAGGAGNKLPVKPQASTSQGGSMPIKE